MDTNGNLRALLLKDLCSRLPYGVMVNAQYKDSEGWKTEDRKILGLYEDGQVYLDCVYTTIDCIKPYLRPMSSMTEEEKKKYYDLCDIAEVGYYEFGELVSGFNNYDTVESIDYLNSIHVDYRGLIPRGLAIEVTKENNPYKE